MTKKSASFSQFLQSPFAIAIFFSVLASLVFVFSYQNAQNANAQGSLQNPASTLRQIEERGIVPCDTSNNPASCKLCDIFKLAKNITDFFVYAGLAVTSAFIGYGGFMILAGSYSEEKTRHGKEILTSAITGLLILLVAWLIVDTSVKVLTNIPVLGQGSGSGFSGGFLRGQLGPWNAIQCVEPGFGPSQRTLNIDLDNLLDDVLPGL